MGPTAILRGNNPQGPNVRFGSKADIAAPQTNVRFTPNSRHWHTYSITSSAPGSERDACSILKIGWT
jgi:hypothetical protein